MEKSIKETLLGVAGSLAMILIDNLFAELAVQKMKTVMAYIGHADKSPKEGVMYVFESKRGKESDEIDLIGTFVSKDFDKESFLEVINNNFDKDKIKLIEEVTVFYQLDDDNIARLNPGDFNKFKSKFFEYIKKDIKLQLVTADNVKGTDFLKD